MKKQRGFTLIETLVSIAIFGIVLGSLASAPIVYTNWNTRIERRSGGIAAVQRRLEQYRKDDPSILPSSGTVTENIVIGTRTYAVSTTFCQTAAYCSSGARHLSVVARFNNQVVFRAETVYAQLR